MREKITFLVSQATEWNSYISFVMKTFSELLNENGRELSETRLCNSQLVLISWTDTFLKCRPFQMLFGKDKYNSGLFFK